MKSFFKKVFLPSNRQIDKEIKEAEESPIKLDIEYIKKKIQSNNCDVDDEMKKIINEDTLNQDKNQDNAIDMTNLSKLKNEIDKVRKRAIEDMDSIVHERVLQYTINNIQRTPKPFKKINDTAPTNKSNIDNRVDWDEYFMEIASKVCTRSTCDRLSVGCVIVKDNRIISTGYNGSVSNTPHCDTDGHLLVNGRCVRTIHAEQNALIFAKESLDGATAYVTHEPCETCLKLLVQSGINKILYLNSYYNESTEILKKDYADHCKVLQI